MAYQDTFSAPTPAPFWTWVAGEVAGDAYQANGVMRLKTTDFYSWYQAYGDVNLEGATITLELVTAPSAEDTETYIIVNGLGGDGFFFVIWVDGGVTTIKAQVSDGTNWQATYDSATHRHVRIREWEGTVYLATSGDGSIWTERVSGATAGNFEQATIDIAAGQYGSPVAATFVEWDNFSLVDRILTLILHLQSGATGGSAMQARTAAAVARMTRAGVPQRTTRAAVPARATAATMVT